MSVLESTPYCYLYQRSTNVYDLFIVIRIPAGKKLQEVDFYHDGSTQTAVDIILINDSTAPAQYSPLLIQDVKGKSSDTTVKITCFSDNKQRDLTMEYADADTTNSSLTTQLEIAKNVPYLSLTRASGLTSTWEPRCLIFADGFTFSPLTLQQPNPGEHTNDISPSASAAPASWVDVVFSTYNDSSTTTGYFECQINSAPRSKGKVKHINHGLQPGTISPFYITFKAISLFLPPIITRAIISIINLFFKPMHKIRYL